MTFTVATYAPAMSSRKKVVAHVGRLLDSPYFNGSPSIAKTLVFCVNSTLAGDESALKETTIGISCFGRDPGYDTKLDPIVRVTIRRMRKKLELFYTAEGKDENIRIIFPKGSYIPRFENCERQEDGADTELVPAPVEAVSLTASGDDTPVTESIPEPGTPEDLPAYLPPWYRDRRVQGVTAFLGLLLVMVLADLRTGDQASALFTASGVGQRQPHAAGTFQASAGSGTATPAQNRNQPESGLLAQFQPPQSTKLGDTQAGRGRESASYRSRPAVAVTKLGGMQPQGPAQIVRASSRTSGNTAIAAFEEVAKMSSGTLAKGANGLEVAGLRKVGAKTDLSPWIEPRL